MSRTRALLLGLFVAAGAAFAPRSVDAATRMSDVPLPPPSCAPTKAFSAAHPLVKNRIGFMTVKGSRVTLKSGVDDWATTVLDPLDRLPSRYVPTDLVWITSRGVVTSKALTKLSLKSEAATALRSMIVAAATEARVTLSITSSYRSFAYQSAVFAGWVAKNGVAWARRYSAIPGHSEHQLGTTVDAVATLMDAPGHPLSWIWVNENAYRFGFVRSYPATSANINLSCYGSEPWHWRYVGLSLAYEIRCSELVPRIVLWSRQFDPTFAPVGEHCGELTPPDGYMPPTATPDPTPTPDPTASPDPTPTPDPTNTP